jgi:hypothetical protein
MSFNGGAFKEAPNSPTMSARILSYTIYSRRVSDGIGGDGVTYIERQ